MWRHELSHVHVLPVQEHQISLEGSVVHVSLQPGHLPNKCIASFAVGPPVLVDFSSNTAKPLPALVMGESNFGIIACTHISHHYRSI